MPEPKAKTEVSCHKPVTVQDLAEILGLSRATVGFVLSGQAEKLRIAPATAKRVLDAAAEHHYVPNPHARSLRTRRTGMIGVIVPSLDLDWAETLLRGMDKVFDETEYVPFLARHYFNAERNRKELLSALQRRDEGLIAFPLPDCDELYRSFSASGIPLVLLAEEMPGLNDISSVVWDSETAAEAAVRHLVETGRRSIAFFGMDYPGLGTLHRFKAYCRVLRECGLELRESWIARPPVPLPVGEVNRVLERWFSDRRDVPDAVFALNDAIALMVMEVLEEMGLSIPGDVALIGIQDLMLSSRRAVGLSTVAEPVEAMGEEAARLMLELISGKTKAPARRVIPSGGVIARRSTVGWKATPDITI